MTLNVQSKAGRYSIGRDEYIRGLDVLVRDGERGVVELRTFDPGARGGGGRSVALPLPCTDEEAVAAAESLPAGWPLYFGINPARKDLKGGAKAGDILRRVWLLVDVDPARGVKDASATDDEKALARAVLDDLVAELCDANWPNPVIVDSGNGYHAYYRIYLTNDTASKTLIKDCLHALAARFDTPGAKVDRVVHDASRISKLPGSWARKGPDSPARPHRMCRVISVPDVVEPVSLEQLEQLARQAPKTPETKAEARAPLQTRLSVKSAPGGPTAREMALRCLARSAERVRASRSCDDGGEGRNNQLARELWLCARFVAPGLLTESEVEGELTRAAESNGTPGIRATAAGTWRTNIGNPHGMWVPTDAPLAHGEEAKAAEAGAEKGKAPDGTVWRVVHDDVVLTEGDRAGVLAAAGEDDADDGEGGVKCFHIRTMECLLKTQFPPAKWVIKDIMSEGLNLLVGSPKQGKSVLALNLALTIAGGGSALGVPVAPADVLYMSLEDQDRRVQYRAEKMLGVMPRAVAEAAARRLSVVTSWPRQDEGGLKALGWWLQKADAPGLVIIDVWNRFAPQADAKGNAYRQDADAVSEVKRWCDRHRVAGLVVHHDRKVQGGGRPEEDFVASISGTQGIAGSADGIMVLVRQRKEKQAELKITGRDVEERSLSLEFDGDNLTWKFVGKHEEVLEGKVQVAIVDVLKHRGHYGATSSEIAEARDLTPGCVRMALLRMQEKNIVTKRGNKWIWPFEGAPV